MLKWLSAVSMDHQVLHKGRAESAQHAAGSAGGLKPPLGLSGELLAVTALFKKANVQTY